MDFVNQFFLDCFLSAVEDGSSTETWAKVSAQNVSLQNKWVMESVADHANQSDMHAAFESVSELECYEQGRFDNALVQAVLMRLAKERYRLPSDYKHVVSSSSLLGRNDRHSRGEVFGVVVELNGGGFVVGVHTVGNSAAAIYFPDTVFDDAAECALEADAQAAFFTKEMKEQFIA